MACLTERERAKNMENMDKMSRVLVKDGINPLYALSMINKVGNFSCIVLFYLILFFEQYYSFLIFMFLIVYYRFYQIMQF